MQKDQFLSAEEAANQLKEALDNLYEEIVKYKATNQTLEDIKERMQYFIESLKVHAISSQELITTLRQIGTQQILDEISLIRDNLKLIQASISENSSNLRESIFQSKVMILNSFSDSVSGLKENILTKLNQLKLLLYLSLSGTAVLAILLIFSLIKR